MTKLLLAAAAFATLLLAPSAFAQSKPAGDAANGKRIFMRNGCYQCHGSVGQGTIAGARIGPPPLNLQGVIRYVRRPAGQMPAFTEKVMSDAELTDVYAYLSSIPAPKPVKEIPLLNELRQ
jgi:ubiquinol-cytochrome c reductase cytochrome c subunit